MSAARDPRDALAIVRELFDALTAPSVRLREIVARCRLRDRDAMAAFSDGELRELIDLACLGATLPEGVAGEAALAYLLAERRGVDPLAAAVARLRALGGGEIVESRRALSEWLRETAARQMAAVDAMEQTT